MKIKVVIYEDNHVFRESLIRLLSANPAFEVVGDFQNCNHVEKEIKAFNLM